MYIANINFSEIPDIGFAFQHYTNTYKARYNSRNMCIEVVYISSGTVEIELYGKSSTASDGDVIVLFRHLPVSIRTTGKSPHSHCSVLAEFESYDFKLVDERDDNYADGFLIPFVTKHCDKTEQIGKILNRIANDMTSERDKNALSSSVSFMSVLGILSDVYQSQNHEKSKAYKSITSSIYKYVGEHIENKITLDVISSFIGKTPNHISHAFKTYTGITVTQYVNNQKAKRIAYLIKNDGISFKEACIKVSVFDVAYGYRLFKRYIGVTPKEFLLTQKITKNI